MFVSSNLADLPDATAIQHGKVYKLKSWWIPCGCIVCRLTVDLQLKCLHFPPSGLVVHM